MTSPTGSGTTPAEADVRTDCDDARVQADKEAPRAWTDEQAVVQYRTVRPESPWPTRYRMTVQPVTGDRRDFYVLNLAWP